MSAGGLETFIGGSLLRADPVGAIVPSLSQARAAGAQKDQARLALAQDSAQAAEDDLKRQQQLSAGFETAQARAAARGVAGSSGSLLAAAAGRENTAQQVQNQQNMKLTQDRLAYEGRKRLGLAPSLLGNVVSKLLNG